MILNFYDVFPVQLLFGFSIFTLDSCKLSKLCWVGIQSTKLNFLLSPEELNIFFIPIDQSATFILWMIDVKWVKYENQDEHLG